MQNLDDDQSELLPPLEKVEVKPETAEEQDPAKALSPRQVKAVDLIANGWSIGGVARAVGVNAATLYRRRMQCPSFRAAVDDAQSRIRQQAHDRLTALTNCASRSVRDAVRLGDTRLAFKVLQWAGCLEAIQALRPMSVTSKQRITMNAEVFARICDQLREVAEIKVRSEQAAANDPTTAGS